MGVSHQTFTARSRVSVFCSGPDLILVSCLQLALFMFIICAVVYHSSLVSNYLIVHPNSSNLLFG